MSALPRASGMPAIDCWHEAYIGLGSNLDHPVEQVRSAIREIAQIDGVRVVRCSSLYETAPVGLTTQPSFVNAVVLVSTSLAPRELLQRLLDVETGHARVRAERNGPRTLDLDILLFGGQTMAEPGLAVPHPRLHERAFALLPLLELDSELTIPGIGKASAMLESVAGQGIRRMDLDVSAGLTAP